MKTEYILEKERELDGLIDDKSEFRYVGGKMNVKILVDKDCKKLPYVKVRSKGGRYISVEVKVNRNGKKVQTSLGRYLLGITDRSIYCDHINRNTLDNRLCNLRASTPLENCLNKMCKVGISGYRNVLINGNSYKVEFVRESQKKQIYVPLKTHPFFAALIADSMNLKYNKEFAATNFPKSIITDEFIELLIDNLDITPV